MRYTNEEMLVAKVIFVGLAFSGCRKYEIWMKISNRLVTILV